MINMDRKGSTILISVMRWISSSTQPPYQVPSAAMTIVSTDVPREASLALLGLGDPVLPTWGKIIENANSNGALYRGYYYWILEPATLLMVTGLGFAMLGFALDRVFNPKLRDV